MPDPYRVWLSEIMLQQTTVATVMGYFDRFTRLWPTVRALADARREDVLAAWAGLGYYARARNMHACAQVVGESYGGQFPDTEDGLRALPGIGPYTAAAIAAIAFDRPAAVVDGNVERVITRIFALQEPVQDIKPEIRAHATVLTPQERPGDYAQAVMDLGATVCTPRKPACLTCPWRAPCRAHALGIAEELPRKRAKQAKPVRRGVAWVARDKAGRVLTVRRPDKGLLGGMLSVPSSDWSESPDRTPPLHADWTPIGEVRHTFTHFHLILEVNVAEVEGDGFQDFAEARAAMPTVFAKVLDLAGS